MSLKRNPSRNVINFAAGPAALPFDVLEIAQRELLNFDNLGTSVMEISHRSSTFSKILNQAENNVRDLLNVPENYKVLFLQGGGNGQFSSVPLNLINRKQKRCADYLVTGYWSERAAAEAEKYGKVNMVLPKLDIYNRLPPVEQWKLDPEASYVYLCDNETINGVELNEDFFSVFGDVPVVADCSSNLFTKVIDVKKYGLIFAAAQKNIGLSGVTLVIIRDDLLGFALKECPTIFEYKIQAGNNSLFQTPPTFGIYICGLVFEWFKKQGGIESIQKVNQMKSELIYQTIDESNGFYFSPVEKNWRSRVTIPFRIHLNGQASEKLEKEFLEEAEKKHLCKELKGHRSVGGLRASIFNAISLEEITAFVNFMKEFRTRYN